MVAMVAMVAMMAIILFMHTHYTDCQFFVNCDGT